MMIENMLPQVVTEPKHRRDFLFTYVENCLREELMEEGLIRKLEPFSRFLQTACRNVATEAVICTDRQSRNETPPKL